MSRRANRRRFTREQCSRGGQSTKGWESEEERRLRELQDAKGLVLRCGMFYTAAHPEGVPWCKRRALDGRTNQIELVYAGRVRVLTGETLLRHELRWARG